MFLHGAIKLFIVLDVVGCNVEEVDGVCAFEDGVKTLLQGLVKSRSNPILVFARIGREGLVRIVEDGKYINFELLADHCFELLDGHEANRCQIENGLLRVVSRVLAATPT